MASVFLFCEDTMKGYYDFITECKDKNYPEGSYLEKHHIVPRSLGGSDDEDNLILLTPEDHYTAHEWLDLMYPNTGMFSWFAGRVDKFQYGEERRSGLCRVLNIVRIILLVKKFMLKFPRRIEER